MRGWAPSRRRRMRRHTVQLGQLCPASDRSKEPAREPAMTENYLLVAMLAVVAFGLMFFWLVYRDRHERPHTAATGGADAQAEREVRAVFRMTSPGTQEAMIETWEP